MMLDAPDKVVRPALIWCDVRTEKQCRELTQKIGAEQLIQLTCNPALDQFHAHQISCGCAKTNRKTGSASAP